MHKTSSLFQYFFLLWFDLNSLSRHWSRCWSASWPPPSCRPCRRPPLPSLLPFSSLLSIWSLCPCKYFLVFIWFACSHNFFWVFDLFALASIFLVFIWSVHPCKYFLSIYLICSSLQIFLICLPLKIFCEYFFIYLPRQLARQTLFHLFTCLKILHCQR